MPRLKRKASHAAEMNNKRWCKTSSEVLHLDKSDDASCSEVSDRIMNLSSYRQPELDYCEGEYIFVNTKQLSKMFTPLKCPLCKNKTLYLDCKQMLGFARNLKLVCSNCEEEITAANSSNDAKPGTQPEINLRITQAFSHIGKGYSAIENLCMVMNISPFSSNIYRKCIQDLDLANAIASQNMFKSVHKEIKCAYDKHDSNAVYDISVSFDGSWLTRGHTSLIGVGCVIDIMTGYVVDFEVMSKVCRLCQTAKLELGEDSAEFYIWHNGHKNQCEMNHTGSSASMEMMAAAILWKRSLKHGFRYTTLLSDGDSKTFHHLCEQQIYGPDIVITKEECVNHVSKRLGTALRTAVKDWRSRGVTLGGKKYGSLKESTIKKLTLYYQKAILKNKGDSSGMKTAIYATLYHSISTDEKPQHLKCPSGENSWCFYQSALAKGKDPGSHKLKVGTPLDEKHLSKILPIYQRLASTELLERCLRCKTQNSNESLHSVIWSKCPKEIFVYKKRVVHSVTEAVCEFNKGITYTIQEFQKCMGLTAGSHTTRIGKLKELRKNSFRERRKRNKFKCARKLVKIAIAKRLKADKKNEGLTYSSGCF